MPYFGVVLGSLLGQGVFSGPVHVAYVGDPAKSRYIERAAAAWGANSRIVEHLLPASASYNAFAGVGVQGGGLDAAGDETDSRGTVGWGGADATAAQAEENVRRDRRAAAANFLQALLLADAHEVDAMNPAEAPTHGRPPFVTLNDDVLVSALFEIRVEALLEHIAKVVQPGERFILSLLVAHPNFQVNEWNDFAPGVVEYPLQHFNGSKALVFSDSTLRKHVRSCFQSSMCVDGTDDSCKAPDDVIRECLRSDEANARAASTLPIRLLAVRHALVQLNVPQNSLNLGPNAVHPAGGGGGGYVDNRRPCKDIYATSWI
jgi:hypothetical protein